MDEGKKTMHEALNKIDDIELYFMKYVYGCRDDSDYADEKWDAQVIRNLLNAAHEAKKLIRLTEYRSRNVEL